MSAPALTDEVVRTAAGVADAWTALRRRTGRVPGVQSAVRLRGRLLSSTAHGWADVAAGTALGTHHVFRVASHSKTFTATAVLRLAERGLLRLDDPLAAHVPWVGQECAELGRASLRELLGHAAGVTRDGTAGDFWQLLEPFPDTAGLRAAVRAGGALLPRSQRFKYSNVGYALLGAVVEAVTETPYGEHVRRELVEPLGLARTAPDLDGVAEPADLVTGYSGLATADEREPLPGAATGAMAAATGFCSTAEDLTAWFSAHAAGAPGPLSEHSRRLAQRAEWPTADPVAGGDERSYGLGFIVERHGQRTLVGHSGGFPGQITKSVLDPASGLAVSVLTNCVDGPAAELALGTAGLVDLVAASWSEERAAADPAPFTGRWQSLWGVLDVVRCGSALLALNPAQPDPAAHPVRLRALDERRLLVTADGGFGSPGETWELGRDGDGTPVLRAASGVTMRPPAAR